MNYVGSPVKHAVKSSAAVVAFGDGLMAAREGEPANFVVNSKGQRGELLVHVTGTIDTIRSVCQTNASQCLTSVADYAHPTRSCMSCGGSKLVRVTVLGCIGVARIFSGGAPFSVITLSYIVISVIYCRQLPFYLDCGVHLTKFSPILPHSNKNA